MNLWVVLGLGAGSLVSGSPHLSEPVHLGGRKSLEIGHCSGKAWNDRDSRVRKCSSQQFLLVGIGKIPCYTVTVITDDAAGADDSLYQTVSLLYIKQIVQMMSFKQMISDNRIDNGILSSMAFNGYGIDGIGAIVRWK